MGSNYWDLDEFLAEEEIITAKANTKCHKLAMLDNSAKEDKLDLEENMNFDIPLWLALKLGSHEFLSLEIPNMFREKFKRILVADPTVVNLRDKTPYYYEIGVKLCEYIEDKSLIPIMCSVFLSRMKSVMKKSFCSSAEESNTYMKRLTTIERRIFEFGRDSITSYKFWRDDTDYSIQFTNINRLRKKVKTS